MEPDAYLKELIAENVENFLHEDAYYEKLATPLKPAALIKEEERRNLTEKFELKEVREHITNAAVLLLSELPKSHFFSKEECEKITSEFENAPNYFMEKGSKLEPEGEDAIVGWQKLFGFSDDTLLHAYTYANDLAEKGQYSEAISVLVFLEMMAPHVASFWLAHAMCLQAEDLHSEALPLLTLVKQIEPEDPLASYHMIQTLKALKEEGRAKEEKHVLMGIVSKMSGDDKMTWEDQVRKI